jgi:glycosyl hydrolase family 36
MKKSATTSGNQWRCELARDRTGSKVAPGLGDEAIELFHMINPINHMRTAEDTERYRVEPYGVAADVYAHPMHVGRGGWTLYTESSGWMYRAAIQALLDGVPVDAREIPLADDGGLHEVTIVLGAGSGLGMQVGAMRGAERRDGSS